MIISPSTVHILPPPCLSSGTHGPLPPSATAATVTAAATAATSTGGVFSLVEKYRIEFDKKDAVYYPGDTVTGK